jgi:hypothetical protein
VRDEQIAAIRQRSGRLQQDRLAECYAEITQAYEAGSIVEHLAHVIGDRDRTPTDFRVLSNSESRRLQHFNDASYHWDYYCGQLGRSIANGERQYVFEELQKIPPTGWPIDAATPHFDEVLRAAQQLMSDGFSPNVLCAPIGLFVRFAQDSALQIDWSSSPTELLMVPGGPRLKIFWSSGLAPLDRFVVLDSSKALWRVKLDPMTNHRLTVMIGEPETPPESVMFLAETVVKFEVLDLASTYSIPVEGDPEDRIRTG